VDRVRPDSNQTGTTEQRAAAEDGKSELSATRLAANGPALDQAANG